MIKIAPSVLSADFANLGAELADIKAAGADMLHIDIMDGNFVPNLSIGFPVMEAMRKVSDLFFDVHLMIAKPYDYIDAVANAGADLITFHVEAQLEHTADIIKKIHAKGKKAGLTLNPATPVETIFPFLQDLDLALVMTVQPGFGGQSFRPELVAKISALRDEAARIGKKDLLIQVDGGVSEATIASCAAAGGNCFVAGSAVFGKANRAAAITALRTLAEKA